MSEPYVGEIRLFAGNFAPAGWMKCEGQIMPIAENETLFNLIGTIYGGDGVQTFALPDLRGRVPLHWGQGPGLTSRILGEAAGTDEVTLTLNQIPSHSHSANASSNAAATEGASGNVLAATAADNPIYRGTTNAPVTLGQSLQAAGGSQPHSNLMPYLVVSYIISLYGVYPTSA